MTVLVVGDAGLDVLARHDGPVAAGGDGRAEVTTAPGGAGANTAAWLAREGVDVVLVGRVGDDPAGRQVRAELEGDGVRCVLTVDRDSRTCCVIVLVDGTGQRTMLADRGAAAHLCATDLPRALLDGAGHLHLSGYVLLDETSRAAGLAMLAAAREAGLTTSVDPQAAALIADPAAFLADLRGVDLLLPNTDELAALTGSTEPASAADLLGSVGAIALTRGADGACWVDADGIVCVTGEEALCVDTTGAGDAFDAGALAAWLAGRPPAEVLRAGVRAGGAAVGRLGARP